MCKVCSGKMVFMADRFRNIDEYKKAVSNQIMILVEAGYQMKVYSELGNNQTIIEFGYDNPEFGVYLEWLNEKEAEAIECLRDGYLSEWANKVTSAEDGGDVKVYSEDEFDELIEGSVD